MTDDPKKIFKDLLAADAERRLGGRRPSTATVLAACIRCGKLGWANFNTMPFGDTYIQEPHGDGWCPKCGLYYWTVDGLRAKFADYPAPIECKNPAEIDHRIKNVDP